MLPRQNRIHGEQVVWQISIPNNLLKCFSTNEFFIVKYIRMSEVERASSIEHVRTIVDWRRSDPDISEDKVYAGIHDLKGGFDSPKFEEFLRERYPDITQSEIDDTVIRCRRRLEPTRALDNYKIPEVHDPTPLSSKQRALAESFPIIPVNRRSLDTVE